ncbi:MAG: hypothetical protein U9O87_06800 [Verrucomicrobiota bacterium]|nr:hypothetical protein [Verrucomicrobiota bacterium]
MIEHDQQFFLDEHAKPLTSQEYRFAGIGDEIMKGPYSNWNLGTGGGSPAHKPWDFWLDEF